MKVAATCPRHCCLVIIPFRAPRALEGITSMPGHHWLSLAVDNSGRLSRSEAREGVKGHSLDAAPLRRRDQGHPPRGGDAVPKVPLLHQAPCLAEVISKCSSARPEGDHIAEAIHARKVQIVPVLSSTIRTIAVGTIRAMPLPRDMTEPGERMRWAMRERGVTLADLVERTGLKHSTVKHDSTGRRGMTAERAKAYERHLGVPWIWLLHGYDPGLSPEELAILEAYRQASEQERNAIRTVAEALSSKQPQPQPRRVAR